MKKILYVIAAIFIISGCNKKNDNKYPIKIEDSDSIEDIIEWANSMCTTHEDIHYYDSMAQIHAWPIRIKPTELEKRNVEYLDTVINHVRFVLIPDIEYRIK